MSKKWWLIFGITQLMGITLMLYASQFEEGASAVADRASVPAMVIMSPGMWAAEGLGQTTAFGWFGVFYGAPAIICSVTVNAICWYTVSLIISRCHRSLT